MFENLWTFVYCKDHMHMAEIFCVERQSRNIVFLSFTDVKMVIVTCNFMYNFDTLLGDVFYYTILYMAFNKFAGIN